MQPIHLGLFPYYRQIFPNTIIYLLEYVWTIMSAIAKDWLDKSTKHNLDVLLHQVVENDLCVLEYEIIKSLCS